LGEIEAALSEDERVREVVVVAGDEDDDRRLVAYVVMQGERVGLGQELRQRLREKLPEYMVPSVFVELTELPLTANGKIDRKRLPRVKEQPRAEAAETYVAPRNAIEEMVATVWSQVLHLEQISVHDNFFTLGGHSLLATQVVTRLRESFHIDLPLRLFFEKPTIAGLASIISDNNVEEADPQMLAEMLSELATLSAEEVKAILDAEKTLP
jgi:acyl carrier protein